MIDKIRRRKKEEINRMSSCFKPYTTDMQTIYKWNQTAARQDKVFRQNKIKLNISNLCMEKGPTPSVQYCENSKWQELKEATHQLLSLFDSTILCHPSARTETLHC